MTIRKKFLGATVITVVLVALELVLVVALLRNQLQLSDAQTRQDNSLRLANELRQSSDELTRTARTYVVTGDAKYRAEYWHILAVRNGQEPRPDGRTLPLRRLLQDAGITPDELQKLVNAEDNSNALVATEVAAFEAMDGHFMPTSGNLSRNTADYSRSAPPDAVFATRIMHDDKYHADKALIMNPIREFDQLVEQRTTQTVSALTSRGTVMLWWVAGLACVLVLVAAGAHFAVLQPVLKSLGLVTGELKELAAGEFNLGRRLQLARTDEIGALASAFNALLEKLSTLVQDVRTQAALVVTRAGEMDTLLAAVEASVQQQGESTHSTTIAAREIAATSAELRRTTEGMAQSAEKTQSVVGQGKAGLERIGASIASLINANELIVTKLSIINERVGQINTMADAIRRVTDQTNLLSLNAAIEAVKAGEFGMGFSVVANEIRRLADQSGDSTEEIEGMIKEIRRSVDAGVMEMDRFRGHLNETVRDASGIQEELGGMIAHVQQLLPMLEELRSTFTGQDQGVQQINDAMLALNEKVQATQAALAQARENRSQVEETGRHLQALVEEMKDLEAVRKVSVHTEFARIK